MSKGYVYVLSNPSMPGLVKVGRTTRSVEGRAKEISDGTGVPLPFDVVGSFLFPDCVAAEAEAHTRLCDKRLSDNREFFRCEEQLAVVVIEDLQREMVEDWVEEFIPDQIIVESDFFFDVGRLAEAARPHNIMAVEMVDVLAFLSADDLAGAVARYRACMKARYEARAKGEEIPPLRLIQ